MADPFCTELRNTLIKAAEKLKINFHPKGTYLRIEGPQFSTKAASKMYRQFADIIGMTCIPEAVLARELGICFAIIATITDYDVWAEKPVDMGAIKDVMERNKENTERIIHLAVSEISEKQNCMCMSSLKDAKA